MDLSELELINSKIVSYGAKLLPVVKNRTNEEIKFLHEFGFMDFGRILSEILIMKIVKYTVAAIGIMTTTPAKK